VLERIIKASCREDVVVVNPFCGRDTTWVVAEKLGRESIGIDISIKVYCPRARDIISSYM